MYKPTIQQQMVKIIINALEEDGILPVISDAPGKAVKKIIKLLEAEDKTLTLLAADLDVPLASAMKCADYGKKAAMAEVEKVGKEYIDELIEHRAKKTVDEYEWQQLTNKIDGVKQFMRRLGV